jgi:hypothetical protein
MAFMVSMPVAIAPFLMPTAIAPFLVSAIILPLVPFRIAVPVTAGLLSTISAASSQRHQHCQN